MIPRSTLLAILLFSSWSCRDFGRPKEVPIQALSPGASVKPCLRDAGTCGIIWVSAGIIGGGDSPAGMDPVGSPAIDSRHRVLVGASTPGVVAVWELNGTVVDTLGRSGEGPGEMIGLPSVIVGIGDTVHVRDDGGSWSVFTPELNFVRKVFDAALPPTLFLGLTSDGHMIEGIGDPLFRVIKPNGIDSIEFGSPEPSELAPRRIVAVGSSPDRFWAVPTYTPILTEWSLDGTALRTVAVENSSFPNQPNDEAWTGMDRRPPPGLITHLVEDSEGLLWMRAVIPDPDYEPLPYDPEEEDSDRVDRLYDCLVEVIDPTSGTVLASATADRMETILIGLLLGPWGFRISQDSMGFQIMEFGELVLGELQEGDR